MKKIVCITGVAGGIGLSAADLFAGNDWHVVGVDCKKPPSTSTGIQRFIQTDLADVKDIERVFDEIQRHENRLDALINNAAVQVTKTLVDTEPNEWDRVMDINVRSVFLSIKCAFPLLKPHGGSIVNVASVHAIATSPKIAAYAASKGALVALTRASALELASDCIRVNAVLPGAVDTKMLEAGLLRESGPGEKLDSLKQKLGQKHTLGRIGKPEEISETILFLADNRRSSFITGQSFVVDGGATARLSTE